MNMPLLQISEKTWINPTHVSFITRDDGGNLLVYTDESDDSYFRVTPAFEKRVRAFFNMEIEE